MVFDHKSETQASESNHTHLPEGKFPIGTVVVHKFGFRGIIYDVDPVYDNGEEWWTAIPEHLKPRKDKPFYRLLAVSPDDDCYEAYCAEQYLEEDSSGDPIYHPGLDEHFQGRIGNRFMPRGKVN